MTGGVFIDDHGIINMVIFAIFLYFHMLGRTRDQSHIFKICSLIRTSHTLMIYQNVNIYMY